MGRQWVHLQCFAWLRCPREQRKIDDGCSSSSCPLDVFFSSFHLWDSLKQPKVGIELQKQKWRVDLQAKDPLSRTSVDRVTEEDKKIGLYWEVGEDASKIV